jgi:ParB-like chromosome segregation protein Spo0J
MKVTDIKLSELKPYEHNNKVHDEEQIEMIANSIKEF